MSTNLAKPYRDLLASQTDPVIRGVLIHTVDVLSTQPPNEELSKKIANAIDVLSRQRLAASATQISTIGIMAKAAPGIVAGLDAPPIESPSTEQLSKAGVVCGLTLYAFGALAGSFMRNNLLPAAGHSLFSETQISIVENIFPNFKTQHRISAYKIGDQMLKDMTAGSGGQGQKFLADFRKAIISIAANWDLRKLPEKEVQALINRLTNQLLEFQ